MRGLALAGLLGSLLALAAARPFVGVLLWSWISFMNPHQLTWGFVQDMPWAIMIFVTTIVGCVARHEPRKLHTDAMFWLILAFMTAISLATFAAVAPAEAARAKWEQVMKVFLFLLITGALLTTHRRIHALLWVMVISLGFYGVRGGGFTLLNGGTYNVFGPPNTMIADNNQLAAALLVTLPLMNYLRLQSVHRITRVALVVMMALSLLAVLGSYSRGALLGLAAMAVFLWWNSHKRLLAGPVLFGAVAVAIAFMPARWEARMNTIETYNEDESAVSRLDIWHTAWEMALARPLTGAGFMAPYTQSVVDTYDPGHTARAVHSIYFEVLGENGFPAFAIWLGMTVVGLVNTTRLRRLGARRPELAWCADLGRMGQVSIIAYLTAGAFLSLCYWDFYFTMLVAVAAAPRVAVAWAGEPARGVLRPARPRPPRYEAGRA